MSANSDAEDVYQKQRVRDATPWFWHRYHLYFFHGLTAIIFFSIGDVLKTRKIPWYGKLICVLCWFISIYYDHIELHYCQYMFPIDILGACGGTYFIYLLCKALTKADILVQRFVLTNGFLVWCGTCSLSILCAHSFETQSGFLLDITRSLSVDITATYMPFARVITALVLAILIQLVDSRAVKAKQNKEQQGKSPE